MGVDAEAGALSGNEQPAAEKSPAPRKRNGAALANAAASSGKKTPPRVTPTKRCGSKPKDKKKQKMDTIERALAQFHEDQENAVGRCFSFTSVCHNSVLQQRRSSRRRTGSSKSDETDGGCHRLSASPAEREQVFSALRVQVGVSQAQGARAYMEDRYSVIERLMDSGDDDDADDEPTQRQIGMTPSLLAIYDGHNGILAADLARKRFRELLAENEFLRSLTQSEHEAALSQDDAAEVQTVLRSVFATVDEEVLALTMAKGKRDGSTVLLGLMIRGKLFVANLGDSRGVRARVADDDEEDETGARDVERVSVDHKPNLEEEKQRVLDAGGKVIYSGCWRVAHDEIPLRLAISRSLGDHPLKVNLPRSCDAPLVSVVPDIHVLDVGQDDDEFLVFASDGLWDRLSDEEAVATVRLKIDEFQQQSSSNRRLARGVVSKEALRFAADALVEKALLKRSMDNITAMVIAWSPVQDLFALSSLENEQ